MIHWGFLMNHRKRDEFREPDGSYWMSGTNSCALTQWTGDSMWPYMIVEVVGISRPWAVVMTSIHCWTVMRPGDI